MSSIFRRTFTIRILLIFTTLVAVVIWVMAIPSRNATEIADLISGSELIGHHKYLADNTILDLNARIDGTNSDIPTNTHSFTTQILAPSISDLGSLRQPLMIEYTSHPIDPEYQGPIKRHTVTYSVGLNDLREIGHTETVLWEYWE